MWRGKGVFTEYGIGIHEKNNQVSVTTLQTLVTAGPVLAPGVSIFTT